MGPKLFPLPEQQKKRFDYANLDIKKNSITYLHETMEGTRAPADAQAALPILTMHASTYTLLLPMTPQSSFILTLDHFLSVHLITDLSHPQL